MRFLPITLPAIFDNLALDEALLLEAEDGTGGEVLRLWEYPQLAVVLGAAGQMAADVEEENCVRDGVPIARRSSGGGTVLLGPGCLLFSLVLKYDRAEELTQIGSSYRYLLDKVRQAFGPLSLDIELEGTSDLTRQGRKFSGNSQQRKRAYLLHHGTLLYNFDLTQVGHYLRQPPRQPEYRQERDHEAFLTNLPLDQESLVLGLRAVWDAKEETQAWPHERVQGLVREKYSLPRWIKRR